MSMLTSTNPMNGEELARYESHTSEEIDSFVEAADGCFSQWRRVGMRERAAVLVRAADVLSARSEELAELMAAEMGKPVTAGAAEVEKCASVCRYYADQAEGHLADRHIDTDSSRSYIHFEPLGAILAVMPWNFPLWQVFRFVAPAVMAGNTALLKHASNVTGTSLAIEDILRGAGAPDGLFRALVLPSNRVREVIANPLVRAVTLTGSEAAGRSVAAEAGSHLKKTVLELGGSDAYIVLADADIQMAAEVCAQSRLINAGQSCIAAKRFVVEATVLDEFVEALAEQFRGRVMGDPLDPETDIGPMARIDLRDVVHGQVQATVSAGATLVMGGVVPDGPGAFYPPTILTGVRPGMAAADEEVFGPAAAVLSARDVEEAIRIANSSAYGLGAAVFTADVAVGELIAAERLEAGCCFVNQLVASDPRLPFGGVKNSGYGRELGPLGIHEFVNAKTVVVA